MLKVSNQEHGFEMAFSDFIGKLVERTKLISEKSTNYQIVKDTENHLKQLKKAFDHLSSLADKKKLASSGVEWFLDNYFVIKEAVEIILDDLPEDYFHKLPALKEGDGNPRIYHIARNLIAFKKIEMVDNDLHEFLSAYQEDVPLRMSELWALPLMLRLVLVEILAGTIFDLTDAFSVKNAPKLDLRFPNIEPDEIVARCLRTLLRFDRINWKKLFEAHSCVDKVLRKDPANIYGWMDFETRDQYRKKIEMLADNSSKDEIDIAQAAVDLASSHEKNGKTHHVGYYLIADGESQLKKQINFQEGFSSTLHQFFLKNNTSIYLASIGLITILVIFGLLLIGQMFLDEAWQLILIALLSLVPALSVAVNLINSILTASLSPKILPKMDFSKGIPKNARTAVCIPALLTTEEEIDFLLEQLELHYLANRDKNLAFLLLSDLSDAPMETMPEDKKYLQLAMDGINQLNNRYRGDKGKRPFYLFHRRRQWNPKEDVWMGWERKRGKLTDFNRYLIEGYRDSFDTIIGEEDFLKKVKYVITVDSDTIIPRDSACSLIATLSHPLNQAVFDEKTGEVISGYTILQPRTEVKPTSVNKSLFTRIFAGDLGLDLYTRAVSDVYQDLFGEGIYVGKGIYDLKAFQRSLEGKVPQNALLSHDLFEGLLGRAGLVSDIVFYEEYPPNYASEVQRLHRWVRGDWQLLPWLFPEVPDNEGKSAPNAFSAIDRWKIFDNLRRSLLEISTFLSLIFGWIFLEQGIWLWTVLILFISAFPLIKNIVSSLSSRFVMGAKENVISNISTAFFRWIFWVVFLPYESLIHFDAIITTLVRVYISHKRLLQWQTSAHTIRIFGKERRIAIIWRQMLGAPILSLAVAIFIGVFNSSAFYFSLPLILVWLVSPQIAYWISLGTKTGEKEPLSDTELENLRLVARRTWLFFERFISPEDHWLPPDHYQQDPKGMVAHRTSPTNIGLMLLSTLSAYDFGYIGVMDFIYRMNYSFDTLDGLEKYRGHLFNWYDTRSLNTLSPRYISTVDSGNYAICLIGLFQALKEISQDAVCPDQLFQGIYDSLTIFCDIAKTIDKLELSEYLDPLNEQCQNLKKVLGQDSLTDHQLISMISNFQERLTNPMNILIKKILESEEILDKLILEDLRYWSESIFQHLKNIRQQIDILAPWLQTWFDRPEFLDALQNEGLNEIFSSWHQTRSLKNSLEKTYNLCENTRTELKNFRDENEKDGFDSLSHEKNQILSQWFDQFTKDLQDSRANINDLFNQIDALLSQIDFSIERMEFDFLFDKNREVFFLGYQVGSGRLDKNHYDLLASEARTASIFAIAQNDVPRSHWLHMSRPFTMVDGSPTLVSWNGSMFEYIMPNLFTRTYPETLLHITSQSVVQAQIDYADKNHVPWGISESSYYRFDQANNYQYRGFGIPGLGRKRGLAEDLVIAPYASLMAVDINPHAVIENIDALKNEGALGHFGFFESIDYTPSRLQPDQNKAVIKSYMAHHQGMILTALANFLNNKAIIDRIHKDPRIQSTELLLQEQIPQPQSLKETEEVQVVSRSQAEKSITATPWSIEVNQPGKAVHVISNGKMRLLSTETSSGYLEYADIALTRWRPDATLDPWGLWFYIQDLSKGTFWSLGGQPVQTEAQEYRVFFAPHMVEIRRVVDDIRMIMQITILPDTDLCMHKISLSNQSNEPRELRLASYGEVVLAPQETDQQHPAFNKMFIESRFDHDNKMLFFQRRKRSSEEESLGMAHLIFEKLPGKIEFTTDRAKFLGRNHHQNNPIALTSQEGLSGTLGTTLDPIFSIAKRVNLKQNQTVDLTFMTLAAENEEQAKNMVERYQDTNRIENAFTSAESYSERLLRALDLDSQTLSKYQELLSRVLYPIPALRPEPEILEANQLGQQGLWSFGISGDYPILLVMIDRQDEIETLQETLLAHTYWRKLGLKIDLVILNIKDKGYAQEFNEKIHHAINVMDSQNWVNRRGGIFVVVASQIDKEKLILLKTASNVVIDFKTRDLEDHLKEAKTIAPHLPEFVSTSPEGLFTSEESLEKPGNWVLDNDIGGFSPDGREYQIYLEKYPQISKGRGQTTPAPWINVVSNENFGFLISESGGGYTWSGNSGENRLSPWTNDPVSDPAGESFYLRDEMTGEIWSPTPYPSGTGADYLVRHSQGYSIFESINMGFRQELKFFVDPKEPVKFISLTLQNQTQHHRRVTGTYFVEWVLGTHRDKTKAFLIPTYDHETGSLMVRNPYNPEFSNHVAFLTSDHPIHGITTDRAEFLGRPGSRECPAGLKRIGLTGKVETGGDTCAALQTHLNFEPGEEKTVVFVLGQGEDMQIAQDLAKAFSQPEKAKESWSKMLDDWDTFLNTLSVETPSKEMDFILNRWLPYQALSCRIWGRSAFYQSSGAYGFRDQLQDVTSILARMPNLSREHILRSARHQFSAGDVLHWWHPPSGRGVRTRISDDLLWLVYVTAEYVNKTGDQSILEEKIPFREGDPLAEDEEERYDHYELGNESYSLFEHCRRALEHGDTQGPHRLPLIGSGDWNDGMNRVGIEGKGESVWLAWFIYENHKRFADLCELMDEESLAKEHRQRADELNEVINQVAWDDDWYLRAYYDDGTPLGSHRSQECKIDSLPQSWSVLTHGAPEDRQKQALNAVENHLVRKDVQLIQLFNPPFDETEQDPGYIKGYPPGIRENGGQYTHAAIWAVWALTELGLGDKAFEQFNFLNPITHSLSIDDANTYMVEPYVVSADIYSTPPHTGHGGWSWYTGSSGWLYRLGMEAILGFRLSGDHFTVEPCIPKDWNGYKMRFNHEDTAYVIEVENPEHVNSGVVKVILDGEVIPDQNIPLTPKDGEHKIMVTLGEKSR